MRAARAGSAAASTQASKRPLLPPTPLVSPAMRAAVEFGLMSTTTSRATASAYSGVDKKRGTVLEIAVGQVRTAAWTRGPDPSQASRSPRNEICSAGSWRLAASQAVSRPDCRTRCADLLREASATGEPVSMCAARRKFPRPRSAHLRQQHLLLAAGDSLLMIAAPAHDCRTCS